MSGPHDWDREVETQQCPNECGVVVAWFGHLDNLCVGRWFEYGGWHWQHGNWWTEHRCRRSP